MGKVDLNADLRNFSAFAQMDVGGDQAAEFTRTGAVRNASVTAGFLSRHFAVTDGGRQAAEINRRTRAAFLGALMRQFNAAGYGGLPDEIKAALVGSHASTGDEDFALDANGVVHSNKPLTARRIRAVMTAIQQLQDKENEQVQGGVGRPAPVSPETVQRRREALGAAFEAFAVKLTEDLDDPRDPAVKHEFVFPPRYITGVKAAYRGLVNDFAKVGSIDPSTGKPHSLAEAKQKFKRLLASGAGGVVHGYWNGSDRTIVYGGDRVSNRVAYKRLVEDLVDGFLRAFNAENPELKLEG